MTAILTKDIRLLLGGRTTRISGFTNVDLFDGPDVDIKADISDLSMFDDSSVSEIYCSHILEHFSHTRTVDVLKEWRRVLKPKAKAYISVPDIKPLLKLVDGFGLTSYVRNLLYGDQIYPLAFHYTIFTYGTLAQACLEAGFSDIKKIKNMPYGLRDCSTNVDTVNREPVSVSVEAIA